MPCIMQGRLLLGLKDAEAREGAVIPLVSPWLMPHAMYFRPCESDAVHRHAPRAPGPPEARAPWRPLLGPKHPGRGAGPSAYLLVRAVAHGRGDVEPSMTAWALTVAKALDLKPQAFHEPGYVFTSRLVRLVL